MSDVSKYELLERIGVGGMAEIFRGRSLGVGGFEKLVAIKKILPHLGRDDRFVKMLIHEARINASLKQRNIVQIYDVGVGDDGEYFLVMEYVPGRDLAALIGALERNERFTVPLDVALFIVGELCEALEHAHRATDADGKQVGLVHRDVSPANVLISYAGEVKLTDFGIAKKTDDASVVASIKGKFAYMSPEQAGAQPLDRRSDVFSLGIILWELTVGRRLFSGQSDFDALRMVREGKIKRPRDVDAKFDPRLDKIVMKALAHKVDDRFASAADLGAELRDLRLGLSSAIEPSGELARMVRAALPPTAPEAAVVAPVRQGTMVRIATAAGFVPFVGPNLDGAPDAGLNFLLAAQADDETKLLRRAAPAKPAAPPPRPAPPKPQPAAKSKAKAGSGSQQAVAAKAGSGSQTALPDGAKGPKPPPPPHVREEKEQAKRAERSRALHEQLFDDLSGVSSAVPVRPLSAAYSADEVARRVAAGESVEEEEGGEERFGTLRIALLVGAAALAIIALVVWLTGGIG